MSTVLVIFFQEVFAQLNETYDSVSVSFFEIYNEKVFDLLGDNKVRILIRMNIYYYVSKSWMRVPQKVNDNLNHFC